MRPSSLALAAALGLAASAVQAADPAPVVAAERAFAADGLALGVRDSFLKHAHPAAILFAPEPKTVGAIYGGRPDDRGGPPLKWWPVYAGLAASGDFGFTTGPATFDGRPAGWYFTVWAREADGRWRWVYDGGTPSSGEAAPGPETEPAALRGGAGRATPAIAMAQVGAAEAELAAVASTDLRRAYAAHLAADARLAGSPAAPAHTPEAVAAELATRPAAMAFASRGGGASAAGDLAWTWGEARWTGEAGPGRGHYVRIWRNEGPAWSLVYDQLLPVPDPKPVTEKAE